jgi:type VI protein secretion system component Hcp
MSFPQLHGHFRSHTIRRAAFDAIRITKSADLASPKLMELAAQGKAIPKAKLECFVPAKPKQPR